VELVDGIYQVYCPDEPGKPQCQPLSVEEFYNDFFELKVRHGPYYGILDPKACHGVVSKPFSVSLCCSILLVVGQ